MGHRELEMTAQTQEPPADTPANTPANTVSSKNIAHAHLLATANDLREMLEGRKPCITDSNKWLFDQLTRLRAGFLISEEPKCLVTLPDDSHEILSLKGDTSIHPIGYPLAKSASALRARLTHEGLQNHTTLGFAPQNRNTAVTAAELQKGEGAMILSKGDVHSLYQAVLLIADRVGGGSDRVPLVLNSHKDLWGPFMGYLRTLNIDLIGLNIHRADTYNDISDIVSGYGIEGGKTPAHDVAMAVRPGATILVQTSNDKKIHELKAILQYQGLDVQVLPFNLLVDKPVEAKEYSRTYAGNNNEKRINAIEKADTTSRADIIARLEAYGADPANTFIWLDDRGLDTMLCLFGSAEFARCSNYLNHYRVSPGVELGNVLKSMSITDFYASMKVVAEQEGPDADLTSHDVTCYMMTPLFPDAKGERPIYTSFGATLDVIGFEPRPANQPHYYSEHFLMPVGDTRKRTKMEIPHYIEQQSSMARAAVAMAALTGMDQHRNHMHLVAESSKVFGHSGLQGMNQHTVLTHTNFFPEMHGHGDKNTAKRVRADFNLGTGRHGHYDYRRAGTYAFKTPGDGKRIVHSGLSAFQNYFDDADAFVLGPYSSKYAGTDEMKLHKMFIFTSLVVGKQVFDPAVYPKFLGVFSREWDECKAMYDDFHRMGFIGQKPEHMFMDIQDSNRRGMAMAITEAMRNHMRTYRRLEFTEPQYIEKGRRPEGLFRATIYCSATSTDQVLRKEAFDLAYRLAEQGFAVKNGGGTEGLMRMTSDGVHAFREDAAKKGMQRVPVNAVISDQYEYTMRAEGLCDWNDHVRVHASIFPRIEKLQDTDAEIVLAGGAGTIQEIVASMITRISGARPVENRPLIIVNQQVGRTGQMRGVYDNLLEYLPQSLMDRANVSVVNTIDEAIDITRFARHAMGMAPKYVEIANDRQQQMTLPGLVKGLTIS